MKGATWLYRIARNRVYQELRRKKQTLELDETIEAPDCTEGRVEAIEWRPELVPAFILVFQGLLLIAVILTVSLYIRERTLTMHQLQTSLAMIEEHLRKMAQKDRPTVRKQKKQVESGSRCGCP